MTRTKERPIDLARGTAAVLSGTAGLALGVGLGALAAARRNRPIHSVGTVLPGTLRVDAPSSIGSPLFDTAGQRPLLARLSRSASWPVELPDINGLALRIPGAGPDGGPADLLFASTGTGRLTRYLLRFHVSAAAGPLTTMLPLAGPAGDIVFRLDPEPQDQYRLSYSRNSGPWLALGRVSLESAQAPTHHSSRPGGPDDARLRFRPVAHPPAGLATPTWVRAARSPAYGMARLAWRR